MRWELAVAGYFALGIGVLEPRTGGWGLLLAAFPLLLILNIDLKVEAVFVQTCIAGVLAGLVLALGEGTRQVANAMLAVILAMVVTLFFLVISRWLFRSLGVRVSPIGASDLYVAAAVGAVVRADALVPALVVAVVLAAAYSVVAPMLKSRLRGRVAPFGPFLCIGGLAALLLS
jgi:prepilin signal peptidase PulO-like enzyme (type II secretory pathway)